jgi:hypothetical protein
MKNILTAFILLLAALFTGCATADKLNDLRIGMSKDQVIALLGQPDSTSAQANIEYLTYYLSNDASYRDQPYMVRLVEGKVESFGRFMQLFDIYNRPVGGNSMGQTITPMGGPFSPPLRRAAKHSRFGPESDQAEGTERPGRAHGRGISKGQSDQSDCSPTRRSDRVHAFLCDLDPSGGDCFVEQRRHENDLLGFVRLAPMVARDRLVDVRHARRPGRPAAASLVAPPPAPPVRHVAYFPPDPPPLGAPLPSPARRAIRPQRRRPSSGRM